jgi:hypothetical protein
MKKSPAKKSPAKKTQPGDRNRPDRSAKPGYPHHPAGERDIKNGSAGAFEATEDILDDEDDSTPDDRY